MKHFLIITHFTSVTVRSSLGVKVGEEFFSSYTYSCWPTLVRRKYLLESKYFECTCSRCADPTELGTHMSTLKCAKCDNGVILSTAPLGSQQIFLMKNSLIFCSI